MADGSAPTLIADAQFTNVRILRPFPTFESVYQGNAAGAPIFFPGTRDEAAGTPGYSPNLQGAITVPFGAKICIWVPLAVWFNGQVSVIGLYRYRIFWRFRNLRDFRLPPNPDAPRKPWHIPIQRSGAPDTSFVPAQPRVIIPGAGKIIAYELPEPAGLTTPGVINIRDEQFIVRSAGTVEGFFADGAPTVMCQGLFDPGVVGNAFATDPIFQPFWFDAEGDEMIISVIRDDQNAGNWDFAGADRPFSAIYGSDNGTHPPFEGVGIYVLTGMNP